MRALLWTVFLVVAAQGIALASTASASPLAVEMSASDDASSRPDARATRLDAQEARPQTSLNAQSARKPARSEAQVLSKNFPRPKPVQIYWFFGGR
jgi:hypothetical protein